MRFNDLESFILEKMRQSKIPGLSLSIVEGEKVTYSRGFGFRELSSGIQTTPRTLYGIGSVTKSFTALGIMQLVERGKIRLDDPVEKYVPLKLRPFGVPVRIHHLLTHSSGLPDLDYATGSTSTMLELDMGWLPVAKAEDVITFMQDANGWAVTKPGERFFYLNEGYVLLGYILSKLSGMTYDEYIQERILQVLGMTRTYFSKSDVNADNDRSAAYIVDKEGRHIETQFPYYGVNSDGGLVSNVLDLSNYLGMCMNGGAFRGKRLLSKKSLELMVQPHIRLHHQVFGDDSYGYGWGITPDFFGYKLVDHGGSVLVHTAYLGYLPKKKVGVALLCNSAAPANYIGNYVLAQLAGVDPKELPYVKTENVLRRIGGEYESYKRTSRVTIGAGGGIIYLIFKYRYGEEKIPYFPEKLEENHATFYTIGPGNVKGTLDFRWKGSKVELVGERGKWIKRS